MFEDTPIFEFDSIKSTDFDLVLCTVDGGGGLSDGKIAGTVSILEVAMPTRWRPIFYGTSFEEKLEFEFSFGLTQERYDYNEPLTRAEVGKISAWLTGHDTYKTLRLIDGDLKDYVFKCMITELTIVGNENEVWGMTAAVTCDSPFAYLKEKSYAIDATASGTTFVINNESGLNRHYYPRVDYMCESGGNFEVINKSDKGRTFKFSNIPAAVNNITVDNENQIITNSASLNLYENFNYKFFRLVPGINELLVKGDGIAVITCEYPVNIGGYIA